MLKTISCRFHPRPLLCVIQDRIPVPAVAVPVPLYVLLGHHRVPAADNQHCNQQSQGPDGQSLYTEYEPICQPDELCQCEFHIQLRNYWQVNNQLVAFNLLTPNDDYFGRTAPLTSKSCILYIYSTNIGTEYFKHCIYSPFFPLQNAVCFINLTYLVPVLFTFYIQGVLKFKK